MPNKARATICHVKGGRCSAGFTFGQPVIKTLLTFDSEGEARRWISHQAEKHGVAEAEIEYIGSAPDA
jgi:hypothetical protein